MYRLTFPIGFIDYFIFHRFAITQRAKARSMNGGVMDEEIGRAIVGRDETETFLGVEPFDGAGEFRGSGGAVGEEGAWKCHHH